MLQEVIKILYGNILATLQHLDCPLKHLHCNTAVSTPASRPVAKIWEVVYYQQLLTEWGHQIAEDRNNYQYLM